MKKWYAVQHGGETDCGTGASNKREARKIATQLHREFPGEEVGICVCAEDSDYCLDYYVIYEAAEKKEED